MLAHSFDRFYVLTKFILPTIDDLNVLPINYDKSCKYLDDNYDEQIKTNIKRFNCLLHKALTIHGFL